MKKINLILIVVLALATASRAQELDVNKVPTVNVTGAAEINVVPDEASFSLKVVKSDKNLATAKTLNDANINKILEITRRLNINPRDVKTDFVSVEEKFDRVKQKDDDEFTDVFSGYTVTKTVVVKLRAIARFEEFFTEVVKIGVTQVSNVRFESSQLRKYMDQARAMAMRAAREKADALAREIGQSIGKAVSIEEENVDGFRSSYANITGTSNSFGTDNRESESLPIGTISVKAQVEVKFLLN